MKIDIGELENNIIKKYIFNYNKGSEIVENIVLDVYIDSIEWTENDIIFHSTTILPDQSDYSVKISEDIIENCNRYLGKKSEIKLSKFDRNQSNFKNIIFSALREIKLNKIIP